MQRSDTNSYQLSLELIMKIKRSNSEAHLIISGHPELKEIDDDIEFAQKLIEAAFKANASTHVLHLDQIDNKTAEMLTPIFTKSDSEKLHTVILDQIPEEAIQRLK